MFSDKCSLSDQFYDRYYPSICDSHESVAVVDDKIYDLGRNVEYELCVNVRCDTLYSEYDIYRSVDIYFNQQMSFGLYSVFTEPFFINTVYSMIKSRKTNEMNDSMITFSMPLIITCDSSLVKYINKYLKYEVRWENYVFVLFSFNYKDFVSFE